MGLKKVSARTGPLTRQWRLLRLLLHLAQGVLTTAALYPFLDHAQRNRCIERWSAGLLDCLAIRIETRGKPPAAGALVVANHISWIDIFAIDSVRAVRFVGKAELRRWPVLGWLIAHNGTLFIDRTHHRHTAHINAQVTARMQRGDVFAVFPEGTITSGDVVLPFHASLLQPAIACAADLYPVAIRYTRSDGTLCTEADYKGEKTIFDSLRLMLTQPVIHAQLDFLPPLSTAGRHRRDLAHEAERAIAAALSLPPPSRAPGKSHGPRALAR